MIWVLSVARATPYDIKTSVSSVSSSTTRLSLLSFRTSQLWMWWWRSVDVDNAYCHLLSCAIPPRWQVTWE